MSKVSPGVSITDDTNCKIHIAYLSGIANANGWIGIDNNKKIKFFGSVDKYKIEYLFWHSTVWYKNGLHHRSDGPAVTFSNSTEKYYWINGKQLTKEKFTQWQQNNM